MKCLSSGDDFVFLFWQCVSVKKRSDSKKKRIVWRNVNVKGKNMLKRYFDAKGLMVSVTEPEELQAQCCVVWKCFLQRQS